jgi:acetyl-CoA synthetase
MLEALPHGGYAELYDAFTWQIPPVFNIAEACADRHPPADLAMVAVDSEGSVREYTFGDLTELSSRLASALSARGIGVGDRIAIVLPQRIETGIAHLAAYRMGAIAVPLSPLFGPEALRFRLTDSGTRVVVTDRRRADSVVEAAADLPDVQVLIVDEGAGPQRDFWALCAAASEHFSPVDTAPDDPAMLIYTSGTTGPPKGALHGHRVLLGHLPGFELMFDLFPQPGDRSWTPADWAWAGGLLDLLLPTWYHGRPVIGTNRTSSFDADWAAEVIRQHGVTATFLPPSALRLLRKAGTDLNDTGLRTVMSGGEPLGADTLAWARERLGVEPNEIYGQTEANLVVGNSRNLWPIRPGCMGRPYPGHEVRVLGASGEPAAPDEPGEIVVRMPDPVAFLGYWNRPDATAAKVVDGWLRTGDIGRVDQDGYLWFTARDDDVINSAGYRIGPGEIEDCIAGHPAVANVAAIGVPDDVRGQVVKAFIVLVDGVEASEALEQEIRSLVRTRLATYEYPREIEFLDELPTTTTGKIRRVALHRREKERENSRPPATDPPPARNREKGMSMKPGEKS